MTTTASKIAGTDIDWTPELQAQYDLVDAQMRNLKPTLIPPEFDDLPSELAVRLLGDKRVMNNLGTYVPPGFTLSHEITFAIDSTPAEMKKLFGPNETQPSFEGINWNNVDEVADEFVSGDYVALSAIHPPDENGWVRAVFSWYTKNE